jgi:hypothetical protein
VSKENDSPITIAFNAEPSLETAMKNTDGSAVPAHIYATNTASN